MRFVFLILLGLTFSSGLSSFDGLRAEGIKAMVQEGQIGNVKLGKKVLECIKNKVRSNREFELIEADGKSVDVRLVIDSFSEDGEVSVAVLRVEESLYFGADEFQRRELEKGLRSTKVFFSDAPSMKPSDPLRQVFASLLLYGTSDQIDEITKRACDGVNPMFKQLIENYREQNEIYQRNKVGE